jgi:hypothetical protein
MWLLGEARCLSAEQRQVYTARGELFVDRGDMEAHWSFYDIDDLAEALRGWPDERMWILLHSQVLWGCANTLAELQRPCRDYPRPVVARKLKWCLGRYVSSLGPLNMAARDRPAAALIAAVHAIETMCRICCLAERRPYPYAKWLVEAARDTSIGAQVCPYVDRAVAAIAELAHPPDDRRFRQWTPIRELRATREVVRDGLVELGWHQDWVIEPEQALAEAMGRSAP